MDRATFKKMCYNMLINYYNNQVRAKRQKKISDENIKVLDYDETPEKFVMVLQNDLQKNLKYNIIYNKNDYDTPIVSYIIMEDNNECKI